MTLFQLYIRYKCRNMTEEEMDPRLKALLKGSWDGNLLNIPHFYGCDAIAYAALKRPLRCNCGITTLAGHEPGRLFHFLAFRRKAYARYMGRAIHPVLRWKALKGKRSRLRLWFREMVWDVSGSMRLASRLCLIDPNRESALQRFLNSLSQE